MLARIENELQNTSTRIKQTLSEIYQHQMRLLSQQQQEEKAKLSKLFDQLIKYLGDDLCSREYSIHDEQIKVIYDETKKNRNV